MGREQPFEVHLCPHVGVDIADIWDDLAYEHYTLNEPSAVLPLKVFDAQPVIGKRIITLNLQIETMETLCVVITGNTWAFRTRLDAAGISGGYTGDEDTRKYVKVRKNLDVSNEDEQARFVDMIGPGTFKHLAMRVRVEGEEVADTHVSQFLKKLREDYPSLHFQ